MTISGIFYPDTYEIIQKDGVRTEGILCKICGMVSYHPQDMAMLWCGSCCLYHDDLWPPARAWCIGKGKGAKDVANLAQLLAYAPLKEDSIRWRGTWIKVGEAWPNWPDPIDFDQLRAFLLRVSGYTGAHAGKASVQPP